MDKLFTAYSAAKGRAMRGDFVDKLHSRATVTGLLVILIVLVSKQYNGEAIKCWLPTQFSGEQESYIHQFCWINNTYYYPTEKDPDQFKPSDRYTIQYYQFILFILSGQIMLFFLPSLIWNTLVSDSGSYINKLLDSVDRSKIFEHECAKEEETPKFPMPLRSPNDEMNNTSNQLDDSTLSEIALLENHTLLSNDYTDKFRNNFSNLKSALGRSSSLKPRDSMKKVSYDAQPSNVVFMDSQEKDPGYKPTKKSLSIKKKLSKVLIKPIRGVKNLAFFYFGMKFFNLANVMGQLIGLRFIFGPGFWRYGYDYITKVMNHEDPMFMSKQFPIVTICDYYVHQNLRRVHWNSSQCLLAINVFIEKFYVFIWLWFYVLLFLTFFNILSWFLEIYSSTSTNFILKYLRIKERMNENWIERLSRGQRASSVMKKNEYSGNEKLTFRSPVNKQNVEQFFKEQLGYDGLVMMHIVKSVAGDMIFIDLLSGLFTDYLKKKAE